MGKKLIIIGGGGHSTVLLDTLISERIDVLGYVALTEMQGFDIPYLGNDSVFSQYTPFNDLFLVNGIGSIHLPFLRRDIFNKFKDLGYNFLSVIHKSAIISPDVYIGEGAQVMAGCVIQAKASIGNNAIINTGATVDHHSHIKEHSHVTPGVTICGDVIVGETSHIGPKSTVIQGARIKRESFFPAHSLVIDDVKIEYN